MSFSFEEVTTLLRLAFTVSGFLVSTASFVTGIYLSELRKHPLKKEVNPLIWLTISLICCPILIVFLNFVILVYATLSLFFFSYLLTLALAPIVPVIAIICVLIKNRPLED